MPVHGPEEVAGVVDGFNAAYAADKGYRVAHHGPDVVPPGGFGGVAQTFSAATSGETIVLDMAGSRSLPLRSITCRSSLPSDTRLATRVAPP